MRFLSSADPESAGRLVLETVGRTFDWTKHLATLGFEGDLVDQAREGLFRREALERVLADGRLEEVEPPRALDVPVPRERVGKVACLGKNFALHAEEFGESVPVEPLVFHKLPECLVASGTPIGPPRNYTRRFDFEGELAVWITGEGRDVPADRALELVGGYTIANDLTLRSLQGADRKLGRPWFFAKNFDRALPLGPALAPEAFFDPRDVRLETRVNDEARQDARTSAMVVGIADAIAHVSRQLTWRPGDLLLMGTPAGVGPLESGDEVAVSIEGLGRLVNVVD